MIKDISLWKYQQSGNSACYDLDYRLTAEYPAPPQITGYEYQVIASFEALEQGLLESPYMPHRETLRIMRIMDELRRDWGVTFPNDEII